MKDQIFDVVVIGAGISGTFLARELSRYKLKVLLLEKEKSPGFGGTKAGLSQIHAADFCPVNTLKAKFCLNAASRFEKISKDLDLYFRKTSELWLAFNDDDIKTINNAKERAESIGTEGLSIITREEALKIEPGINPAIIAALYAKNMGVVYPPEWCFALVENSIENGLIYKSSTAVENIERLPKGTYKIITNQGIFETNFVVNTAGLNADKIAHLTRDDDLELIFRKGTMVIFDKAVSGIVNSMILGTPSPQYSKNIAPTAHGNIIAGLGYFTKPENQYDTSIERGMINEVMKFTKQLVPALSIRDIITSFAGIYVLNNKCDNGDYYINHSKKSPGVIHALIGAPGLTTAPAVAEYIIKLLAEADLKLEKKNNFIEKRKGIKKFNELNKNEIKQYISDNKMWAKIICRCEKISEAEIVEAIRRGATTIDEIKHYTRAGMGRCQGGFCTPAILKILARETGLPITQITKNNNNSIMVKNFTKI